MTNIRYLVIFECDRSCWPADEDRVLNQEILNFCAVLLNLETGKIEDEFYRLIKPTEVSHLSEDCINITGITQRTVDNCGVTLSTCLIEFSVWLQHEMKVRNLCFPNTTSNYLKGNVTLASWTDWDFECLSNECTRKNIHKPAILNQWTNIRKIYVEAFKYSPFNFDCAVAHIGLEFNACIVIACVKNLAAICVSMFRKGALFRVTRDISDSKILTQLG